MKWLNRIADGLAILGGLTAVALVCVTVISVFWRYILDDPIFGVDDLSRMMLAVVVAGSIGYGARTGAHVYVDILSLVGGDRVTRVTDVIVRIIGAGVVAAATWALWLESLCGFECGEFTDNLGIIHTPFYRLLAAGMAVYCGILVLELFVGPTDKPGKPDNRRRDDAGPR